MTKVTLRPSNIESLKGRIGGDELRESKTREKYLDKLSRLITDVNVKTELGSSAYSRTDDNRDFYIEIPKTKTEQSVTNLDEDVWDLLFQETVLFHEMGHVLYTDFDAFEKYMKKSDSPKVFRHIFNSISDGCIETYLANDFNIEKDLILMNANLVGNINEMSYNPYDAISAGLIDNGFYNSGRWEKMMNGDIRVEEYSKLLKFEDRVKEVMEKAIKETSGKKRVEIAYEFTQEILDEFSNYEPKGSGNPNPNSGKEFEKSSGKQKKKPEVPEETESKSSSEKNDDESDDGSESNKNSGENKKDNKDNKDLDEVDIEDIEDKVNDEYQEEVQRQNAEKQEVDKDNPYNDQLMTMASGDNLGKDIFIPDYWSIARGLRSEPPKIERKAQSLERILRSKLQRERASKRKDGLREGRLNTTDLAMAATGSSYLFSRQDTPDDKSYSVQIILDRSYSMKDHGRLESAQNAAYQTSVALANVGVDVSVMSFYNNDMYLEVPFNSDPKHYKDYIFSRKCDGGTPLGRALDFSKEQLKNGKFDEHFVLIITDGEPSNKDHYLKVLGEIDVPVYGVYVNEITRNHGNHSQYFDSVRYGKPDEVDKVCRQLCEGMIG